MQNKRSILIIVFIPIFIILLLRLAQLQIIEAPKYKELAIDNAAKSVIDPAPRGIIFDRRDKVLVANQPIYTLQILPHVFLEKTPEQRQKILERVSRLIGEKINFKVSPAAPIFVKNNLSKEAALRVEEHKYALPGIVIVPRPVRLYPHGDAASHLLGYIGEIAPADLLKLRENGYKQGDYIGKDGVEKNYDKLLRGIDGGKRVEVDVYGTPLRLLEEVAPTAGANMQLTIDLNLQLAVEKALSDKEGAVVVLDPRTGEILALASHPNYDPNLFVKPVKAGAWAQLGNARHPFMNRALATYPPGSIFKVITLAAALEEKKTTPQEIFYCPGYYKLNNRIAKCWKISGHGHITPIEGLTQSCDVVFFELGRRLGPDKLAEYAHKFGLGARTGIDLPQEKKGQAPDSAWKKEVFKENWYEGDSINYGIGQGFLQVTPLQMGMIYASIATGKFFKPYVVRQVKDVDGRFLYQAQPRKLGDYPASEKTLMLIRNALAAVVKRATGVAARVEGIPAAGKTGTAENPGLPHAWFICYAPYDKPEIVIVAFVVHGQHGDRASAYIARDILQWYKNNRLKL